MVIEILLILILAAILVAVFFEKTLKIEFTLVHKYPAAVEVKTEEDPNTKIDYDKMERDAFNKVTEVMQMFAGVDVDENDNRT